MILKVKLKTKPHLFGIFVQIPSPAVVELAGYAGFDFVIIDFEHGPLGIETATNMVRAANAANTSPVVRVAQNDSFLIGQALDIGAEGIMVPQITDYAAAVQAIKATRYGADGLRGACPCVRSAKYAGTDASYFAKANEDVVTILLLEGREAIDNIRQLVTIPNIDVLMMGVWDLSSSLGIPGQVDSPLVMSKLEIIIKETKARGIDLGSLWLDGAEAKRWAGLGIKFLPTVDTTMIIEHWRKMVQDIH
ncbi:MAG: aldolase/citrate lyase family protein, partial [Planctomycetes bacterium]|nr:aldolase/citrate lyase family protein [Planctomycetota bacterium]